MSLEETHKNEILASVKVQLDDLFSSVTDRYKIDSDVEKLLFISRIERTIEAVLDSVD